MSFSRESVRLEDSLPSSDIITCPVGDFSVISLVSLQCVIVQESYKLNRCTRNNKFLPNTPTLDLEDRMEKAPQSFSASSGTMSEPECGDQDVSSKQDVNTDRDEMPTLVVKLFIESITEVETLKKIRLVNKYWNLEACQSLRKLSTTTLRCEPSWNSHASFENFTDFHAILNDGAMLSLPCPFQQLSIQALTVPENILSTIINRFGLDIKSFDVHLNKDIDLGQIRTFLTTWSELITTLTLQEHPWSERREAYDNLRLPSLHGLDCLHIFTTDIEEYADFVKTILCSVSPLTRLAMHVDSTLSVSKFSSLDLTRIQNLDLYINEVSDEDVRLDALATVQLPALKILRITISDWFYPPDLPQLYTLIKKLAPSLESLEITRQFELWNANIGVFPKLKYLALKNITRAQMTYFTLDKFPSLKEIHIEWAVIRNKNRMDVKCVPHEVVKHISIDYISVEGNSLIEKNRKVQSWLTALTRKFPNVNSVSLQVNYRIGRICLQHFNQAYPQLKFLKLTGWSDLVALKKQNLCWDPRYDDHASFRQHQELESLVLQGHKVYVETIQNIAAHISKLKYLRMPWCEELSVEVFRDSLQHLHVLEISNFVKYRSILTQLRAVMPGTLVKARYSKDEC